VDSEPSSHCWPVSVFAEKLTGHTGIGELMDDLGEALIQGRGKLKMMGGGTPAHLPEIEAIWRKQMGEMLRDRPDEFDRMLGDYDQPAGSPDFLRAVAGFLNREYGWGIGPENVAVTNGAQTALFYLLNRFAGKMAMGGRKKILLPIAPEYIGYADVGVGEEEIFEARKPKIELIDERTFKYRIDFENLNLSDQHGAIAISRPTNPSSNVLTDAELSRLRELASARGIPLIIDNAYGLPFPGVIFGEARPVWDENMILTISLSKLGLPGTRTGIVIARDEVIREISSMNAIIGLANNNVGQAMARPILESGEILHLAEQVIRPFYRARADHAIQMAKRHLPRSVPWRMHRSEGAFFLWFWLEGLPVSSRDLYSLLKEKNLIIVPGEYFFYGIQTKDWRHAAECIRVSFTQSEEVVEEGFQILGQTLQEIWKSSPRLISH